MSNFGTRFYDKVPQMGPETQPLKYSHRPIMEPRHSCTDPICGLIFFACLSFGGYIMSYAFQNGDPRKVYHGMDYQGNLCGVDLPYKPYVYWCKGAGPQMAPVPAGAPALSGTGPEPVGAPARLLQAPAAQPGAFGNLAAIGSGVQNFLTPTNLDFGHPICVMNCPQSAATESMCFDSVSGGQKLTPDYATHPVAKRYCFPQAPAIMKQVADKMGDHAFEKYLPEIIETFRNGWPALAGALVVGFILSMMYMLLIECCAGPLIWTCLMTLIAIPGSAGAYLVSASLHGGVDGIPSSGDAQTDKNIGIACCVVAGIFFFATCCMKGVINRAIHVVETTAECLFHCKSLLLEPIINLVFRIAIMGAMLAGLAWLLSVGEVRKSKIYRSFTYTEEQQVYIVFYAFMMLWINDFITAMSQYVIAAAASRWYFTEHIGGVKHYAPQCLLCKSYWSGWFYHFGSLAFGSVLIATMRPIRIAVMALVYAETIVDNAVCGCIAKCCLCCVECFNSFLVHLSKTAYIVMAVTSKGFCPAGQAGADLMLRQSVTMMAAHGATWIFTVAGTMSVAAAGAVTSFFVVQNVEQFSRPTSQYYIQDPIVCAVIAGVICGIVALGFMMVFDTVADTMLICLAYDREEQKSNPVPIQKQGVRELGGGGCGGWFGGSTMPAHRQEEVRRPQFTPAKMSGF